jgi:hypothetical protein
MSTSRNHFHLMLPLIDFTFQRQVFFGAMMLLMLGCSGPEAKQALVKVSDCRPVIDGKMDDCWKGLAKYPIDGALVGEINWDGEQDFSAEFQVLLHDNDLYFLVTVIDDIEGKIEASASSQYWENDNVEFFFTNGLKLARIDQTKEDSIYFVNYSVPYDRNENMVNIPDKRAKHVAFGRTDFEGGFVLEARFEYELGFLDFSDGSLPFNLELSDNDNTNEEEGFVKGRESGLAWSYNSARTSWQESLNYGDLVLDQ